MKSVYDHIWRRVRKLKLDKDPLCEMCLAQKKYTKAKVIHHITSIQKDPGGRLNLDNLKSLCRNCHEKTHQRLIDISCDETGFPSDRNHIWNKDA